MPVSIQFVKLLVGQVFNSRHEFNAQQMAQSEEMFCIAARVHMMALWLDRKYFSMKTLSPWERSAPKPPGCWL